MGAFEIHDDHVLLEPQIAWHDVNVNILEFLEEVPASQQIRIRGEEVMADPEGQFGEICRWLRQSANWNPWGIFAKFGCCVRLNAIQSIYMSVMGN